MRITFLPLLVLTFIATIETEQPLKLDVPVATQLQITDPRLLRPCDLGLVVPQVGRGLNAPVGFENGRDCWLTLQGKPGPNREHTEDLSGMSPRQALDHLIEFMPAFSWKEFDGVIAVRPRSAWSDPRNVLNLPTAPFEARNARLDDALHTMLDCVRPRASVPHEDIPRPERAIDRPVTVRFRGGTLLEAVNEIARARTGVYWQLAYDSLPGRATIEFGTFDSDGIIMAPVAFPQRTP
jgi:hypothetical protein